MQPNALAVVFIQMVPAVIFPIIPSTFRTASIHDLPPHNLHRSMWVPPFLSLLSADNEPDMVSYCLQR